jgi:hypothetical protein
MPKSGMKLGVDSDAERRRRSRASHAFSQNVGLVLVVDLFAPCIIGYCVLFVIAQHRFPGRFELTSTLGNTMPLALDRPLADIGGADAEDRLGMLPLRYPLRRRRCLG